MTTELTSQDDISYFCPIWERRRGQQLSCKACQTACYLRVYFTHKFVSRLSIIIPSVINQQSRG